MVPADRPAGRPVEPQGDPMSTTTWIVLGVIVLLVLWIIVVYNGLVAMRQRVNQSFADIDVQMKQRHDLIPNLVETVKGYAGHERGTLEAVIKARNSAIQAGSSGVAAQAAAENQLSGALRQLFALSEAYPDLKANQNFLGLQSRISELENQIADRREYYNDTVTTFNTRIEQLPDAYIANSCGYRPAELFRATDRDREDVTIAFQKSA
jgi:LemA protein